MAPSPPSPPPSETNGILDDEILPNDQTSDVGAVSLPNFGSSEQNGPVDTGPPPPQDQEPKSWEKPLTIPEIRKNSNTWSLASDAGLLLYLQEFSQRMIAKTSNLEKEVDGLVHNTKSASSKVHNTFNDFLMLANTQFIENRVYDDAEEVDSVQNDTKDSKQDTQSKSREQREAEVIPRVMQALQLGVKVLDTAFEQLDANVGNSDSEDEDATYKTVDPILEPKDLYAHRSLPYIIGTPAFMQDDEVGLADLQSSEDEEEDEFSEEETESSESEYSESELSEEESETVPRKHSTAASKQDESDEDSDNDLFDDKDDEDSDDEEGSKPPKPKAGGFADELATRIGAAPAVEKEVATKERSVSEVSRSSRDSTKHSKKNSKKKKGKKKRAESDAKSDDDLFGSPEPEEEDSSPFGKKGGLFSSSGGGLFDADEDEGGLFDDAPKNNEDHIYEDVPSVKEEKVSKKKSSDGGSGLFADDEDDFFGAQRKDEEEVPKKKGAKSAAPKPSAGGLFEGDEDEDDLFAVPAKTESKPKEKSVDLFADEDEEDDLFGDKPPPVPKDEKPKKKLPAGAVSIFGAGINPLANRRPPTSSDDSDADDFEEPPKRKPDMMKKEAPPTKPKAGVFGSDEDDDEGDLFAATKESAKPPQSKPADSGLFDEEDDDLFSTPKEQKPKPKPKEPSDLFADIEDEGTEDDLFAATAKPKETGKKKPVGGVALFGGTDIFVSPPKKEEKAEETKEQEEPPPQIEKRARNKGQTNTLSLFNDDDGEDDDDDDDGLFVSKPNTLAPEPKEDKLTKRRTKSKSIFDDEDVLFGTAEEDPSVDLFGGASAVKKKPDSAESPTKSDRDETKPKSTAPSKGLFSDDDEDDLFGGGGDTKPAKKKKVPTATLR